MDHWPYVPGRLYSRQADIHARFGGQQRGGIATPSQFPVVFAFTGEAGAKHGYADEWQADGSFHYTGEGQIGAMMMVRGNRAIAHHAGLSHDLLLFQTTRKGQPVRFIGQFVCAGWFTERLPDTQGDMRDAIIFKLVPLAASVDAIGSAVPEMPTNTAAFNRLRMQAYAASGAPKAIKPAEAVTSYFARSKAVRDYALARANGRCECCDQPAPFTSMSGAPFLEVHHVERLSDGGPDSPSAVAAICPNCHREAHLGQAAIAIKDKLRERIRSIEKLTVPDLHLC
jgi:5-methylcytosine-specific restriction enzyme A